MRDQVDSPCETYIFSYTQVNSDYEINDKNMTFMNTTMHLAQINFTKAATVNKNRELCIMSSHECAKWRIIHSVIFI